MSTPRCSTLVVTGLFLISLSLAVILAASPSHTTGTNPNLEPNAPQPPYMEITIPIAMGISPASRPPVATYEWRTPAGYDDPAEVRWILISTVGFNDDFVETEFYIRNNPNAPEWSAWQTYSPPGVGTSWTSPPMDLGRYVFAIQGRDGGGVAGTEFDLGWNMRRVVVSNRTTGPVLEVTGDYIDPIVSVTTNEPITIITIPAGTPVDFCWTADASVYGGVVTGYRYGWDITDLNDDSQWDISFTPFSDTQECSPVKVYYFGTHVFSVEVIDNDGFKARVEIKINYEIDTPVEPTSWGRVKARYSD